MRPLTSANYYVYYYSLKSPQLQLLLALLRSCEFARWPRGQFLNLLYPTRVLPHSARPAMLMLMLGRSKVVMVWLAAPLSKDSTHKVMTQSRVQLLLISCSRSSPWNKMSLVDWAQTSTQPISTATAVAALLPASFRCKSRAAHCVRGTFCTTPPSRCRMFHAAAATCAHYWTLVECGRTVGGRGSPAQFEVLN